MGTQLATLGSMHPAGSLADVALQQRLARAVPQIYAAFTALSSHDMEVVTAILSGSACIWVGTGFVPAERVAFRYSAPFVQQKLSWKPACA
jgi:sacsin